MEKTTKPKLNDGITLKSYTIQEFNEIQKKGKNILVELDDVNVQFGVANNAVKAMKHVNLNIYKGEVLGLVGESGSGKSTTGNAIMGLVNRASGTIKIDGIEMPNKAKKVKGRLRKYFAQQIQMIFQDPATSLDPQKSIRKVLMEGLNNLDIKPVFSRNFDITTINNLYKLLHGKKQPEAIDKITLSRAKYLIANNKLEELSNRIYEVGRIELRKMDEDYAHLAATYLDLRKEERKYYFEGKDVDLKMKNHIINDLLESVGLTKQILNRFPLEFSGGQQQRIGISRAVSMQPKLLIADEPISALDVSIQSQVVNIFNDLKQKFNLTILFIAHDLRMVEYISDRIAIMYGGRILEIGDAKEIMKNPIHPYSKSLLSAVPSINKLDEDLKSKPYDHEAETASLEHYKWFKVEGKNHFVFGAQDKVVRWLNDE